MKPQRYYFLKELLGRVGARVVVWSSDNVWKVVENRKNVVVSMLSIHVLWVFNVINRKLYGCLEIRNSLFMLKNILLVRLDRSLNHSKINFVPWRGHVISSTVVIRG